MVPTQGGKRVAHERHALHTASREAHEETLGLLHLEDDGHAKPTAVCWNPVAKVAKEKYVFVSKL